MNPSLALYEILPLRTTAVLGDFAGKQTLPHRLGDLRSTRFPLVKLDASTWFAADHPMQITKVFVDDEATPAFAAELRSDALGNTWTVVKLSAPAPPDSKISASGIGRLNVITGAPIENPADLMEYALRLAGRTETFPLLRAECAQAGIVLAGSLDKPQSIRDWLDEIAYSAGAMWTPEMARLYPVDYIKGSIVSLGDIGAATDVDVRSDTDDTADILRIYYDLNDATGSPQQFIELTANPQRFGGITSEITLKWMRQAANAETIGRRTLRRMAGIRYSITHNTDLLYIRPGQWTDRLPEWPIPDEDPTPMVLSVEPDYDNGTMAVESEWIASSPAMSVTAHSVALPSTTTAAVSVALSNGSATFTIFDENGKPMKDALVSLDNAAPKKTNEAGNVTFAVKGSNPPKKHQLAIHKVGFVDQVLDIYL